MLINLGLFNSICIDVACFGFITISYDLILIVFWLDCFCDSFVCGLGFGIAYLFDCF